jgi:hypothetical protein
MKRMARFLSRLWLVLALVWWALVWVMVVPPGEGLIAMYDRVPLATSAIFAAPLIVYAIGAALFWACLPLAEGAGR